jgi:predicted nucleic acid-binding protein
MEKLTVPMKFIAIQVEQEQPHGLMNRILALARVDNLPSYDAVYLDVAIRKGLPSASLDSKLVKAARSTDAQSYSV